MEDVAKESASVIDLGEESKDLKSIPPGFSRGLRLPGDEAENDILSTLNIPVRLQQDGTGVLIYAVPLDRITHIPCSES